MSGCYEETNFSVDEFSLNFFMVEELLRIIELRLKGKFFGKVAGLVSLVLGEEMWFYVSDSQRGVFWIFVEGC